MRVKHVQSDYAFKKIFFSSRELSLIQKKVRQNRIRNAIVCSFENRFARCGGLASVVMNYIPYIKEINKIPSAFLLTPFFPKIMKRSVLHRTGINFSVPFGSRMIRAEIYEYEYKYALPCKGSLKEYYVSADNFFVTAGRDSDPYIYDRNDRRKNDHKMKLNAVFFCQAVPFALRALGITKDMILHLHEWQASLISLSSKFAIADGILDSCASVQTIHNSYDAGIPKSLLSKMIPVSRKKRMMDMPAGELTAYQIGLRFTDAPVTTVSRNFAKDLLTDELQVRYYAPHLQDIIRSLKIYGINNGRFLDFSPKFPEKEFHTIEDIMCIKLRCRHSLLKMLSSYRPYERIGCLTYKRKLITRLPDNIPIVFMSGRLDPLQKGYGILLRAIESFREDEAKFILAPLPVRSSDLDYFYEVACKCWGNVTVFPLRIRRGFDLIQTGSTFGIMPSVYEPFGAAIEYMVNGTVNISRATGGLIDQVDSSCGFLYREDQSSYSIRNVKAFINAAGNIQARKSNPWFVSMARSLEDTLRVAFDIYRNSPERYYKMIINGFKKAGRFSWEKNAREYYKIYRMTH